MGLRWVCFLAAVIAALALGACDDDGDLVPVFEVRLAQQLTQG